MICSECGEDKEEKRFSWSNKEKGIRQRKCKKCHSAYVKLHYLRNKQDYKDRAKRDRKKEKEKTRQLLLELKKDGCKLCGESHPSCLVFHHRNPHKKEDNIADLKHSRKKIIDESKKCDILCSNCHLKLHWGSDGNRYTY